MLELEGLRIEFEDFAMSAAFHVAPGRFVALLGPSGAGKSTLLSVMAGFLAPTASVAQNVALALSRKQSDKAALSLARSALARVGLTGLEDRLPGTLSGGQQSRAALARVLLQDKPLVLLDEPFSALGPGQRADMMALCREILGEAGRTVLFVTHDADDASRADEIAVVADGMVAAPVPADRLLADPPDALRHYLGK